MALNRHHNHPDGISTGAGTLQIARKPQKFIDALVYYDQTNSEQRICVSFEEYPDTRLVKSATQPFASLHLDIPIYAGTFPISQFNVFLLSASVHKNRIDVVISPKSDKLDPILRNRGI